MSNPDCEVCGDVVAHPVQAKHCTHIVNLCETCKKECPAALNLCLACEEGRDDDDEEMEDPDGSIG